MKTLLTTIILSFFFVNLATAQEVKYPLEAKVENEGIPETIADNQAWVKGHWEFKNGKYVWLNGEIVNKKDGHSWVDGKWKRNTKTGWWVFNPGYWQKDTDEFEVKSNNQSISVSSDDLAESKKPSGFFINTGGK